MSKRKRKNHKTNQAAAAQTPLSCLINPDAAGIDVGAQEFVAAVPRGRDAEGRDVRTFSSFTESLHALRDWLLECKIKTVAMESTGNYWLCACAVLEDAGIEVCGSPTHQPPYSPPPPRWSTPGMSKVCPAKRPTFATRPGSSRFDKLKALSGVEGQLHSAGLLRASFRPRQDILPLRYLMRHRADLITQAGQQVQLMQKVMTEPSGAR